MILTGISLSARSASQLVVDTPRFMSVQGQGGGDRGYGLGGGEKVRKDNGEMREIGEKRVEGKEKVLYSIPHCTVHEVYSIILYCITLYSTYSTVLYITVQQNNVLCCTLFSPAILQYHIHTPLYHTHTPLYRTAPYVPRGTNHVQSTQPFHHLLLPLHCQVEL